MDVTIKKVGQREGQDRFILLHLQTRRVLTVHDVSARSLQRFFRQRGVAEALIDTCLRHARERYEKDHRPPPVDDAAETIEDHDLLFELGLDDDAEADADIH